MAALVATRAAPAITARVVTTCRGAGPAGPAVAYRSILPAARRLARGPVVVRARLGRLRRASARVVLVMSRALTWMAASRAGGRQLLVATATPRAGRRAAGSRARDLGAGRGY